LRRKKRKEKGEILLFYGTEEVCEKIDGKKRKEDRIRKTLIAEFP